MPQYGHSAVEDDTSQSQSFLGQLVLKMTGMHLLVCVVCLTSSPSSPGDQSGHFAAAAREPLPLETPSRAQPHHRGQAGGGQTRQQGVLLELVRRLSSPQPPHQDRVLCPTAAGPPHRVVRSLRGEIPRVFFFVLGVLTSACCYWTELSFEKAKGRADDCLPIPPSGLPTPPL